MGSPRDFPGQGGLRLPGNPTEPHLIHPATADQERRRRMWKEVSKTVLVFTYVLCAVSIALVIWQLVARSSENHVVAWSVAGMAVAIAVPLSLYDINSHIQTMTSPLQVHYVRILGMVPIYALESWFALRFKEQRIYLEVAREAYEAFVIYSFFRMLVEFLKGTEEINRVLESKKDQQGREVLRATLLFPFSCLQGCQLRGEHRGKFMFRVGLGVFQYVVLRTLLACINLVAAWAGTLCPGSWGSPGTCVHPWTSGIINVSQFAAM
jgi:hypothetical protein